MLTWSTGPWVSHIATFPKKKSLYTSLVVPKILLSMASVQTSPILFSLLPTLLPDQPLPAAPFPFLHRVISSCLPFGSAIRPRFSKTKDFSGYGLGMEHDKTIQWHLTYPFSKFTINILPHLLSLIRLLYNLRIVISIKLIKIEIYFKFTLNLKKKFIGL